MINELHIKRMADKLSCLYWLYRPFAEKKQATLDAVMFETMEHFTAPPQEDYSEIKKGRTWGGEYVYGWFKTEYTVPEELAGQAIYLIQCTGGVESIIFIDGKPVGEFDNNFTYREEARLHRRFLLTDNAVSGKRFDIVLESYCGHLFTGYAPWETPETDPGTKVRTFDSIEIVTVDKRIEDVTYDMRALMQLWRALPDTDPFKFDLLNCFEKVYAILPMMPAECDPEELGRCSEEASKIMAPMFSVGNGGAAFKCGLIGHSHMDTVWLWPLQETKRKLARTFANALKMMEIYPEYTFMASSAYHYEIIKQYYPDIFEGIKKRVAEGRWEATGGTWIEMDGNITGGEAAVRQFLYGQKFFRENFGFTSDVYWLPDTFGYSAAIPQIMKQCEMKYFLTSKLSWNDTNRFPYDSFNWVGIDGSGVDVHLHSVHMWPDVEVIMGQLGAVTHKHITPMKLIPYGFGDGGGGPAAEMIEMSRRVKDLRSVAKCEHTTVSKFMDELSGADLPRYTGELYVEAHRGTITSGHDIKRLNRACEILLRDLEILGCMSGKPASDPYFDKVSGLWYKFLPNQFHDILPGTCYPRGTDEALMCMNEVNDEGTALKAIIAAPSAGNTISLTNTLSCTRESGLVDGGIALNGAKSQSYTDVAGDIKTYLSGINLPSMSTTVFDTAAPNKEASAFSYGGGKLITPLLEVTFDQNGCITSLVDREKGRELRGGGRPLNTFITAEDVPSNWDNWDIDYDHNLKLRESGKLLSREVAADGALMFILRSSYSISDKSTIKQDMIFYADRKTVDFDTVLDWSDKHLVLKADFNLNIHSSFIRNECQYGFVERSTSRSNSSEELAKFETCNHRWSDISENRYGIALLNNSKYGLSNVEGQMALTLMKAGIRPDPRGDKGVHRMHYALHPHRGGFGAETVVRPAYEYNDAIVQGGTARASFAQVDAENVIIETIKPAEDRSGMVMRLYECEKSAVKTVVTIDAPFKAVYLTNMLEDKKEQLIPDSSGRFELDFKALEIKTILLEQ